jgi:hypothetical protein
MQTVCLIGPALYLIMSSSIGLDGVRRPTKGEFRDGRPIEGPNDRLLEGEYRQEIDAVIGSTGSHRSRDGPKSPLRAALAWSAALSDCGIGYGLRATGYGGRGRAANDSP